MNTIRSKITILVASAVAVATLPQSCQSPESGTATNDQRGKDNLMIHKTMETIFH